MADDRPSEEEELQAPGSGKEEAALKSARGELKATKLELAAATRRSELAGREKERAASELLRALERGDKMEVLCRELQKQREASKALLAEEQARRQEIANTLSTVVKDIQGKLDERQLQGDEQQKALDREAALHAENVALHARITAVLEKEVAREKHAASQLHAKALEAQLADARLRQSDELLSAERERATLVAERAALSEAQLREQLGAYAGKFESFQGSLAASTEALGKLRAELERGGKRMRTLERENDELRARLSRVSEQRAKLEGLCRTLQEECRRGRAAEASRIKAGGAAQAGPDGERPPAATTDEQAAAATTSEAGAQPGAGEDGAVQG